MRNTCPYCKSNLGELNKIMDILAENKVDGITYFSSDCCNQRIKAYSKTLSYFIVAADPLPEPQIIGGA